MLKEVTDSIKLTLYERATSPMIGVLVLSWLTFNWRIPLVLFWGDGAMQQRIALIDEKHLSNPVVYLYLPLITATVILVGYPFLSLLPFYWWHKAGSWRTKLKQRIEGSVLLTVEQSNTIKEELFKLKEVHREEVERYETQTATLSERMKLLQMNHKEELESQQTQFRVANERIEELERGLIERTESLEQWRNKAQLADSTFNEVNQKLETIRPAAMAALVGVLRMHVWQHFQERERVRGNHQKAPQISMNVWGQMKNSALPESF